MTVSERLRSWWGPSRLAYHGHLRSSQWSKPQKLHLPPFEWKNKSLLWHPSRCVEWKATSVTAAEFYGAVILNDLHVPGWIRLSFIHKTFALNSLFLLVMWKNLRVFMSHNSAEFRWTLILLSDSVLQTKKLQAKVWNSTCRTISVCKLLQNVNFDDLTFLTALVLYSKSDYLNHSNRDTNWRALWEYRACWRHCCSLWK